MTSKGARLVDQPLATRGRFRAQPRTNSRGQQRNYANDCSRVPRLRLHRNWRRNGAIAARCTACPPRSCAGHAVATLGVSHTEAVAIVVSCAWAHTHTAPRDLMRPTSPRCQRTGPGVYSMDRPREKKPQHVPDARATVCPGCVRSRHGHSPAYTRPTAHRACDGRRVEFVHVAHGQMHQGRARGRGA